MALKFMVVDDDPMTLKLLKTWLVAMGYEVLTVEDSREAAERVNHERFDGIFVDGQMPHLDGFELARRIRASAYNHGVPLAMLTAFDDATAMRAGFDAGIMFFLGKPPNRNKLLNLVKLMQGPMLGEKRLQK